MANKNNEKKMATELSGRPWSWLLVCVVVASGGGDFGDSENREIWRATNNENT
jgi:hypothetical protein